MSDSELTPEELAEVRRRFYRMETAVTVIGNPYRYVRLKDGELTVELVKGMEGK